MIPRRRQRSFTITELIVCMAVLAIVMGVASLAHYRYQWHSHGLIRSVDDIRMAVAAGERWRDDIRSADKAPRLEGDVLHISKGKDGVMYRFADGAVQKKRQNDKEWQTVLRHVKASEMLSERRKHVECWRWELELQTRSRDPFVRPLFSFQAVPGNTAGRAPVGSN